MRPAFDEGFTFHDVLLVPRRSSVASRKDVSLSGRVSRNIVLKVPIVSANMDTVTESAMAIAMARIGGLGIIHRFLTIEEEAEEVAYVKRAESFVIENPYTLFPYQTVKEAKHFMERHGVGGLLVINDNRKLIGVVSMRDVIFNGKSDTAVAEVMSKKLITAKPGIALEKAEDLLRKHKIEKLPLVDDNGRVRGLITAQDIQKLKRYPHATKDPKGRLLVGAAVGVVGDYLERGEALVAAGVDLLVVDVAHGHADHVIAAVKKLKARWPKLDVVAGNVATYEGARDLARAGADGIKVGVGPGSTCTTRIVTGAGVPQLSAVLDCARITRERGIPVIADGGLRDSGDMTKALAAGASCVMVGSLLGGCDESPGSTVTRKGMKYKVYRGMASLGATLSRRAKESGREVSGEAAAELIPEGVETVMPYRGLVSEVVGQLVGGVRSGFSYCGARTLAELWKKAKFIRITQASWAESRPHAVE